MATPSAGASQSSRHPTLTFGHLIENHVDQDVGATPASAVTANGRREMRTRQAVLPPLPTCPRQRVPSRSSYIQQTSLRKNYYMVKSYTKHSKAGCDKDKLKF